MDKNKQDKESLKPKNTSKSSVKLSLLSDEQRALFDATKSVNESFGKMKEVISNLSEEQYKSLYETIKSIQDSLERSLAPIHEFAKEIDKKNEELSNLLKGFDFSSKLNEYFKEIRKTYREAFDIAKSGGYLISPEQLFEIAGIITKDKEKSVGEVLTTVYNEEMFENMLDWANENTYFRGRKTIFEESIKAYLNGWYYLTIYSLLPQIEGVIWDFLITHLEKEELNKIKGSPKEKKNILIEDYLSNTPESFFAELLKEGFKDDSIISVLFADQNLLECNSDEFNRHSILHGVSTQFATKGNALRIMLLFDFVLSAIRYLEKP